MKLFAITAYGSCGGGMAVVRAASEERAIELASTIKDRIWHTDYRKFEQVTELLEMGEGVLHHFETGE